MPRTLLVWCALVAVVIGGCDYITDGTANGGLVGTSWTVERIGGVAVGPAAPPTMIFAPEGVSGNAGCNTYNGTFRTDGDRIVVGPLATTKMACADAALQGQEAMFLGAFGSAMNWEQTPDGKLILGGPVEIVAQPIDG